MTLNRHRQWVEGPLPEDNPSDPAAVVRLYAQAINARSLEDYLALHAGGFAIERPDDERQCLPWLDAAWWEGGPPSPECSSAPYGEFGGVERSILPREGTEEGRQLQSCRSAVHCRRPSRHGKVADLVGRGPRDPVGLIRFTATER